MGFNKYYKAKGQLDLTDRLAIETGLCGGEKFKRILNFLKRCSKTAI